MRLATWNINGFRARLEFLSLWLEERRPHPIGLQELKLEDEKFPYSEVEKLGYSATVYGQKSWNGVAILSRIGPPDSVERGLVNQESSGSRLLSARFGDLEFATVYCPNGKDLGHEDFPRKLQWYDDLIREWGERKSSARVLCGDFNLCPGPLDTWSEELLAGGIFHTAEERQRFESLLGTGLVDLYRAVEPDGTQFSWWDYRGGSFHRNQGLRIDFLLGSEDVTKRIEKVWTDRDYRKKKQGLVASDHAPVIAELSD